MSALKLCGIEVDTVVAASTDLQQTTRDVGEESQAVDGSTYVTRSATKLDFGFKTVPLSLALSFAWWCFFRGEGEAWSFDVSLYGSKGTGPATTTGSATRTAGGAKYGAGVLTLGASSSIVWTAATRSLFGRIDQWTVSVWRNAGAWTHYVVNSAGQKWVNGVRSDATATTFLTVSGAGDVTLSNASGSVTFDDLVVVPYVMPLEWPPQVYATNASFGPLPALPLTGDFVTEQVSRAVIGNATEGSYQKVAGGVVLVSLDVELRAR